MSTGDPTLEAHAAIKRCELRALRRKTGTGAEAVRVHVGEMTEVEHQSGSFTQSQPWRSMTGVARARRAVYPAVGKRDNSV